MGNDGGKAATTRFATTQLVAWAALYGVYLLVRSVALGDPGGAFVHAGRLVELERAWGLFHEARVQEAIGGIAWLGAFLDLYYMAGFGPLLFLSLVWLGLRRRPGYRELRTAMLVSIALASVVFVLYPTAPPRLVDGLGIADTVGLAGHDAGSFAGVRFNPYAAMPSMHVGWSLLAALVLVRTVRTRIARVAVASHPLLMTVAVIGTGNHFLLDAIAGAAVALVAYALVSCRTARLLLGPRTARALTARSGRCQIASHQPELA